MNNNIIPIIIAAISSSGFFAFIQFMVSRHDNSFEKKLTKDIIDLRAIVDYVAQGCTRTQLMFLITHFGDRSEEVMKVAYKYFHDMGGNWYMGGLFKDYCEKNNLDLPEWYHDNI